jgi:thiosulfate dehydrogenase [quinone] large subunit
MEQNIETSVVIPGWRKAGIALLRIAFGVVWAIDAHFKWYPAFLNNFVDYMKDAQSGQPAWVVQWLNGWINFINLDPKVFSYLIAVSEALIALCLLLGILNNLVYLGGGILSLTIWATAEGFGGPYVSGSTDIGTSIIYVLVFIGLFLLSAGHYFGVDRWLRPRLGILGFLSCGGIEKVKTSRQTGTTI